MDISQVCVEEVVLCGSTAALYLTKLDESFCNEYHSSTFFSDSDYDDIIILRRSKSQFVRAKKRLKKVLLDLKLTLSPTKTKMGKIHDGFHFLGLCFKRTQPLKKCSKTKPQTAVSLHKRCYHRALEKVKLPV